MWGDKSNDRKVKENESIVTPTPAPEAEVYNTAPSDTLSKPRVTSTIGQSMRIEGIMKSDEDVVILGQFKGQIELKQNNVAVGRTGRVEANIVAKSIRVEGEIIGDAYAQQITILRTGSANGNLHAPRVIIEDGARFKGNVDMDPKAIEKRLGQEAQEERNNHQPHVNGHHQKKHGIPMPPHSKSAETEVNA